MNKFDKARYNSPSGREDPEPYTKAQNIAAVAKAKAHAERTQTGWRFGENQAKKIDHDAPPK